MLGILFIILIYTVIIYLYYYGITIKVLILNSSIDNFPLKNLKKK